MLEEVREEIDFKITPLIGGIAEDLSNLLRQELALARSELRVQTIRLIGAGLAIAGAVLFFLASLLLGVVAMIAFCAETFPFLPLWAICLAAATALFAPAILLLRRGKKEFERFSLIPEKALQPFGDS